MPGPAAVGSMATDRALPPPGGGHVSGTNLSADPAGGSFCRAPPSGRSGDTVNALWAVARVRWGYPNPLLPVGVPAGAAQGGRLQGIGHGHDPPPMMVVGDDPYPKQANHRDRRDRPRSSTRRGDLMSPTHGGGGSAPAWRVADPHHEPPRTSLPPGRFGQ
jgi:hypothetical protein